MSKSRATVDQFVAARQHLYKPTGFTGEYVAHLKKVWNEADGPRKGELIAFAQVELIERFGFIDGSNRFAAAMNTVSQG